MLRQPGLNPSYNNHSLTEWLRTLPFFREWTSDFFFFLSLSTLQAAIAMDTLSSPEDKTFWL